MIAPVDAGPAAAATLPRQGRSAAAASGARRRGGGLHRWLPLAVVAAPTLAAVHQYGVGWRPLAAFCAYVVGGLAIPGTLVWRAVRRRSASLAEDVPPGLAAGYAIEVLTYLPARAAGAPLLVLVAPIGVWVAFLGVRRLRRYWRTDREVVAPPVGWLWSMALVVGLVLLFACLAYLRTWGSAFSVNNHDLPFHLALAGEVRHHLPPQVPWVAGEPLLYHWFGYLDIAATSWVTGIEAETLQLRLSYLPMVAVLPLLLAVAAHQLTGRWWPGPVAAAVSCFGVAADPYSWPMTPGGFRPFTTAFSPIEDGSFLRLANWNSFSQTFAAVICVPLVVVLVDLLRGRDRGWRAWVTFAVLVAVISGAKATYLPILLAGVLAALVVRLASTRRLDRTALAAAGVLLLAAGFAHLVLFRGASQGMVFEPLAGLYRAAVVRAVGLPAEPLTGWPLVGLTALTLLVWAAIWCGIAGLLRRRRWADPAYALLIGVGLAGLGGVLAFSQPGNSQGWFIVAARPYLALAAASGLAALVPAGGPTRSRGYALAGAAALGGGTAWLVSTGGPERAPSVATVGERAALFAVGWPYLVLLGAAVAVGLALRVGARRVPALRGLAPALLVVIVTAYGAPAAVEKIGQPALAAVGDRFAEVDGPPILMPRGARVAGRWLRDHSGPDHLVATNAHCREPGCTNLRFWFTAFAERRFLVEGWGFTDKANGYRRDGQPLPRQAPFWDPVKLADNDAVFRSPSAAGVDRLRRTYGVRWLLVDETQAGTSPDLARFASLRFRAGSCAVYEL
jgi:hypothetical protein